MRFSKHTTAAFAAVAMAVPAASLSAAAAPVSPYVDTAAPGAQLRDLGRMAPTNVVHLAFNLRYQHEDELDRDVMLINTKGTPDTIS